MPTVAAPGFLSRGLTPSATRPGRLFFAGNVPDAHLVDSADDHSLAREAYSEGVRQLVWKYHRRRRRFTIVSRTPSYADEWARHQYCLAPLGVGWGVRLAWAIAAGCVPVLAASEVAGWFEDALDYRTFALAGVPKTALRRLPALLDSVPQERLAALQAALWKVRTLFLWRGPTAYAYNVTMHELCWRARRRRARVNCTALLPAEIAGLLTPPAVRAGVGDLISRKERQTKLSPTPRPHASRRTAARE